MRYAASGKVPQPAFPMTSDTPQIPARLRACLPPFKDQALWRLALTHASLDLREQGSGDLRESNERLEFLGDTVLDLVVAEFLYRRFPGRAEGDLTQMKANLVSRATLAEVAREWQLGEVALIGGGLQRGHLSRSVLANLLEAVIGAIYLDQGLAAAERFIECTLGDRLRSDSTRANTPSPKQQFQEYCQKLSGKPPRYRVLEQRGEAHARAFLVAAEADGQRYPSAWGRTIKEAESWAALEALLVLDSAQSGGPTTHPQETVE